MVCCLYTVPQRSLSPPTAARLHITARGEARQSCHRRNVQGCPLSHLALPLITLVHSPSPLRYQSIADRLLHQYLRPLIPSLPISSLARNEWHYPPYICIPTPLPRPWQTPTRVTRPDPVTHSESGQGSLSLVASHLNLFTQQKKDRRNEVGRRGLL